MVLLSMDFSHDSVASVADARDDQAKQAILALDSSQVKDLNVDCPKGLWLLLATLGDLRRVKVQVAEHTNSARLTENLSQPDVTSYFTVYFVTWHNGGHGPSQLPAQEDCRSSVDTLRGVRYSETWGVGAPLPLAPGIAGGQPGLCKSLP
jgi:hypothetical protein